MKIEFPELRGILKTIEELQPGDIFIRKGEERDKMPRGKIDVRQSHEYNTTICVVDDITSNCAECRIIETWTKIYLGPEESVAFYPDAHIHLSHSK